MYVISSLMEVCLKKSEFSRFFGASFLILLIILNEWVSFRNKCISQIPWHPELTKTRIYWNQQSISLKWNSFLIVHDIFGFKRRRIPSRVLRTSFHTYHKSLSLSRDSTWKLRSTVETKTFCSIIANFWPSILHK